MSKYEKLEIIPLFFELNIVGEQLGYAILDLACRVTRDQYV
jgi:hypothetical protein